jgi:RNA polymerase sigma factor (sigma-70 family)
MAEAALDFEALMQRVRQGSPEAARQLVSKCGPHILRMVRRRMNVKMRARFDSADFVQSVWASFFAKQPENVNFDKPEALVAYLVQMAHNKVIEEMRDRMLRPKNDVSREHSLDGSAAYEAGLLTCRQPRPSQVFVAQETYERMMEKLDAKTQAIVERLRAGHMHHEIAKEFGVTTKTVQRVLHKLLTLDRTAHEPSGAL